MLHSRIHSRLLVWLLLFTLGLIPARAENMLLNELPDHTAASGATTAPGNAAVTEDNLDRILSGQEKITALSEKRLLRMLNTDWNAFQSWLTAEKDELLFCAWGAGITLLCAAGILVILRKSRTWRTKHPSQRLHVQLFFALAGPTVVLLAIILVFGFMLPVLESLPALYSADAKLFFTLITVTVAWAGLRTISVFSSRLHLYAKKDGANLDALMIEITRKVLKIVLVAITVLFIGQSIFELNITTLLAGAGVVGLAIAFASRETLSNFFGTLVIILDRPFRCGDRIQVNGIDGIVEDVGMRSTRIRTSSESLYSVPNSLIASSNVENISNGGLIRFGFTVGLVYESTAEEMVRAMQILHEITDDFHGADPVAFKPRIFFDNLGASGMNIKVIMWLKTDSFSMEEKWRTEINLEVIRRFNAAKLVMAYNTVTNILSGDPDNPLVIVSASPPAPPTKPKTSVARAKAAPVPAAPPTGKTPPPPAATPRP